MTIVTFPTAKETETAQNFADTVTYERYYADRLRLENGVTRQLDAALKGIAGRSKAKTKLDKINFLLGQDYWITGAGIIKSKEETPTEAELEVPIVPEPTPEAKVSAELMAIDPKVATKHYPLLQWIEAKKADPEAIVMVQDQGDNRCWITFAGDATITAKLLHLMKNEVWFGDQCFDLVRIGKTAFSAFSSRLKDKGYRAINPLTQDDRPSTGNRLETIRNVRRSRGII